MNENHARLCPSPEWAEHLQRGILPVLTRDVDLGPRMLEIGPGPGAATSWLAARMDKLTAIEIDPDAAQLLAARYAGSNVEIVTGTGTELGYPAGSFDSVGCFTMLHHVPTVALQNAILAGAFRVLRPGGVSEPGTGRPTASSRHGRLCHGCPVTITTAIATRHPCPPLRQAITPGRPLRQAITPAPPDGLVLAAAGG